VPGGSRRARDQRTWLRAVLAEVDSQGWYSCRARHTAEIARVYARYMDWRLRTARPGHDRVAAAAGVSVRTVKRVVRWLAGQGFLGVVSPGTTPLLRPGVLHGLTQIGEGNQAAIYVLTTPRKRAQINKGGPAGNESGPLSRSRRERDKAPRAREARPGKVKGKTARPAGGLPDVPRSGARFPMGKNPETRTEGLAAAGALRNRSRLLAALSPEHLRHLCRALFTAGWSAADVLHALDHSPAGRQHGYTATVRQAAGWVRWRLSAWLRPDGTPLPSPGQARAAAAARDRLAQDARRAERRHAAGKAAGVDVAARAAHARALLTAALR